MLKTLRHSPVPMGLPRQVFSAVFRTLTDHDFSQQYLHRIGVWCERHSRLTFVSWGRGYEFCLSDSLCFRGQHSQAHVTLNPISSAFDEDDWQGNEATKTKQKLRTPTFSNSNAGKHEPPVRRESDRCRGEQQTILNSLQRKISKHYFTEIRNRFQTLNLIPGVCHLLSQQLVKNPRGVWRYCKRGPLQSQVLAPKPDNYPGVGGVPYASDPQPPVRGSNGAGPPKEN
ncbi:hypothetical protein TNCV_879521 [Trichonephila clavipes]|nr:hypothetical protein TNCV_879521 [Trichonephila clavipes]